MRKFGLKMQLGSGTTASKTEAIYYPSSTGSYEVGDATLLTVPGPGGEDLGFVSFTKESRYFGSIVRSSLTSDVDVDKRIRSAVAAFGALRGLLCKFALEGTLRGEVYYALVQVALLYDRTCPCPLTSDRTRNARAPTSPRSIGFCAIWDCISSSSSSAVP